jgi:hypothetical protein
LCALTGEVFMRRVLLALVLTAAVLVLLLSFKS